MERCHPRAHDLLDHLAISAGEVIRRAAHASKQRDSGVKPVRIRYLSSDKVSGRARHRKRPAASAATVKSCRRLSLGTPATHMAVIHFARSGERQRSGGRAREALLDAAGGVVGQVSSRPSPLCHGDGSHRGPRCV
jgi:hypothetical protein